MTSVSISACRGCGKQDLLPVLDLGRQPLANALLRAEDLNGPEPYFPLRVVFCPDCALMQITETLSPELLFRDYVYFSSVSNQTVQRMHELAERLAKSRGLDSRSLVAEIASNDGYLLRHYQALGIPVLGIEPARNIARVAQEQFGIPTLAEFFDRELAESLVRDGQQADIIHANNVLAHVADLHGVVDGIRLLLKPDGIAVIEVPYVADLVERSEFDTIYHEHLCYFSVSSLVALFARFGLRLSDVEHIGDHGGSLRLFIQHVAGSQSSPMVERFLSREQAMGMRKANYYRRLRERAEHVQQILPELLRQLRTDGALAGYGAAAKGSTLVNYCGIGPQLLDYVVDRSPHKQGRFMPGTHLRVEAPGRLLELQPRSVLLLSWNFAEEIAQQQSEYVRRGGQFVIPVPEPAVWRPIDA